MGALKSIIDRKVLAGERREEIMQKLVDATKLPLEEVQNIIDNPAPPHSLQQVPIETWEAIAKTIGVPVRHIRPDVPPPMERTSESVFAAKLRKAWEGELTHVMEDLRIPTIERAAELTTHRLGNRGYRLETLHEWLNEEGEPSDMERVDLARFFDLPNDTFFEHKGDYEAYKLTIPPPFESAEERANRVKAWADRLVAEDARPNVMEGEPAAPWQLPGDFITDGPT